MSDSESPSTELMEKYRRRGYREEHRFPSEYVLMVNPSTLAFVRLYPSGAVWEQDPITGEYASTPPNEQK